MRQSRALLQDAGGGRGEVARTLWSLFVPYIAAHSSEFVLLFALQLATTLGLTRFTFASRDFMNALHQRDRQAFMRGVATYVRWVLFLAPMTP